MSVTTCPSCSSRRLFLYSPAEPHHESFAEMVAVLSCRSCHAIWDNIYTFSRCERIDPSEVASKAQEDKP